MVRRRVGGAGQFAAGEWAGAGWDRRALVVATVLARMGDAGGACRGIWRQAGAIGTAGGRGDRRGGAGGLAGFQRGAGMGGLRGERELAGLPEDEDGFQAGEQAGEGGENQGVQGRHQSSLVCVMVGLGADRGGDGGDLLGQRVG